MTGYGRACIRSSTWCLQHAGSCQMGFMGKIASRLQFVMFDVSMKPGETVKCNVEPRKRMDKEVVVTLWIEKHSVQPFLQQFVIPKLEAKQGYCALVDKFAPGWRCVLCFQLNVQCCFSCCVWRSDEELICDQILSFWSMFFSIVHFSSFRCGGLEQGCE